MGISIDNEGMVLREMIDESKVGKLSHEKEVSIRVFRDKPDELAMSKELIDKFVNDMINGLRLSVQEAIGKNIMVRSIQLEGKFVISGKSTSRGVSLPREAGKTQHEV